MLDRINLCKELVEKYMLSKYHSVSLRQYLSNSMDLSLQQTDRFLCFFKCIEPAQQMMSLGIIPFSSAAYFGTLSNDEQQRLYQLLSEARKENIPLTRERIIVPLFWLLKNNSAITWKEAKPHLKLRPPKALKSTKEIDPNSAFGIGFNFTQTVLNLLPPRGYRDVTINNKRSYDRGLDAFAVSPYGDLTIAFQMKYHKSPNKKDTRAVKEAFNARMNFNKDLAIAVTNRDFSLSAQREAKELGVILWDGEFLRKVLGWDGKI